MTMTCRMTIRAAKSDAAAAQWRKLAAGVPTGSMRERVYLNLARTAEDDANVSYLRSIHPRRSTIESLALPVRVIDND